MAERGWDYEPSGAHDSADAPSTPDEMPIYLDYNATTPHDPEVVQAMIPVMQSCFGNPSSGHPLGRRARDVVETARKQVASLVQSDPDEVVFTSGGTESNNWAIKGAAARGLREGRAQVITSAIEHPAVLQVCQHLESTGVKVIYLPVSPDGLVRVEDLVERISPQTCLISIMHSNNEMGAIQPIEDLCQAAKSRFPDVLFHTDASQSVGKTEVSFRGLGVDMLTVAGHKLYAPKGVGALVLREGTMIDKMMHGAGHERGKRAGTENTILIAGLGKACQVAERDLKQNIQLMRARRSLLEQELRKRLDENKTDYRINGPTEESKRLPNTLSISIKDVVGSELVEDVSSFVAISAGSACHHGSLHTSPILQATKVPYDFAKGTIRVSTGKGTSEEDVRRGVDVLAAAVERALSRTLVE